MTEKAAWNLQQQVISLLILTINFQGLLEGHALVPSVNEISRENWAQRFTMANSMK